MNYLLNLVMGSDVSIQKVNYEDIRSVLNNSNYLLINTLPNHEQKCLIYNTLEFNNEEAIINNLIKTNKLQPIILYGKNSNDHSVYKKYQQFTELGFTNLYIYTGGLFEWLLLQDIYGKDLFKTTSQELDIIKYKSKNILDKKLIK